MTACRLLQLLDQNRSRAGFRIVDGDPELDDPELEESEASGDGEPDQDEKSEPGLEKEQGTSTIYIYDAIGGLDGIQAGNFVKSIAAIQKSNIHIRINSPGGDVFDARAIKTALEQHPATVTATIDGLAASAASFLMLAADTIQIAKGAFVMIHNPWGLAMGDAKEMRATAALLDHVGAAIRSDYRARTGLEEEVLAAMMDDETWMPAEEAINKGFCDGLLEKPPKASAKMQRRFDLSAFDHPPQELIAPAAKEAAAAAASAAAFRLLENARLRQMRRLKLYA